MREGWVVYVIYNFFFRSHRLKGKEKPPRGIIFCVCICSAQHNLSPRKMFYSLAAVAMAEKCTLFSSSLSFVYLFCFFFLDVVKLTAYLILWFSDP